jgi:ABC-type lipoprotein release transport system permease subunit
MTLSRLLLQNLFYHWRGNLAVLLGVAVGTAVLTGALLVGDSLRGSLRDRTLEQLGWVDHALVGGRFIREELADQLNAERASPAILLQGSASVGSGIVLRRPRTSLTVAASMAGFLGSPGGQGSLLAAATLFPTRTQAGRVSILGVRDNFWAGDRPPTSEDGVVVNSALADDLGVEVGDWITLHMQKISLIPRETLLGQRDDSQVVAELTLPVRARLPDQGLGRFTLNPTALTPRNAFVPLRLLQNQLHQPGRVNSLLVGGPHENLSEALSRHLTLEDWGLILHTPESRTSGLFAKLDVNHDGKLQRREWNRRLADTMRLVVERDNSDDKQQMPAPTPDPRPSDSHPRDGVLERSAVLAYYRKYHDYLALESRQMILEPTVARAAENAAVEARLRAAPTLVYLANGISDGQRTIPYSAVAALDTTPSSPLGPFLPPGLKGLQPGEIVLADWKDSPLHARPGDTITLTYFEPEQEGRLKEASATFRLAGLLPLHGAANDPDLTPEFPGITDKLDLRDWNPPFPYDPSRVQRRDEHFWEVYRTTPKAYVTLADGQRLWSSRFGSLTSIRLAPAPQADEASPPDVTQAAADFRKQLLSTLRPEEGGLVFEDVRARGLEGSAGASDFGQLFAGFSIFLIVSALLLVGLLFRLNLDRRASEIGLLLATGYRRGIVARLLLAEGSLLSVIGGVLGLVGSLIYASLMLAYLQTKWPGGFDLALLHLHVGPLSLVIGYGATLLISVLTISLGLLRLRRVSPRAMLAGEVTETSTPVFRGRPRWSLWVCGAAAVLALGCLGWGGFVHAQEMQAMAFFSSGAMLLTTILASVWAWMLGTRHGRVGGHGALALARLGVRNAARHPVRSLLTAGLLASATFLIVAVQSFYREAGGDGGDVHSGSGGFALLGDADVPIYQDLNSPAGREELNIPDNVGAALQDVRFYSFRVRAGDDASCLNLYQPRRPRLLGVPHALIAEHDGFQFQSTEAQTDAEQANPWLLLERARDDGAIPVFGEANTVQWQLHRGLGQELEVPDEHGNPVRLRFVGLLQDSFFQSELLLSEAHFLQLYPRQEGYQFVLIQTPPGRDAGVKTMLESALADHGFYVTRTADRLQTYLAVENTYLSTFQALGGLGLVLGALGLAVVLLQCVWERRGELALLRALGFRQGALGWLVLAENSFLLVLGLAVGTLTALVAVAPHLLSGAGAVPVGQLAILLGLVLAVGLIAGAVAVGATLQVPLLTALRRE